MALDIVLRVGRGEVARRTLEHRLRDVALPDVTRQLRGVHVLLADHAELEGARVRPLSLWRRCLVLMLLLLNDGSLLRGRLSLGMELCDCLLCLQELK